MSTANKNKGALKKRVFEVIQIGNTKDTPSRMFDDVLILMVLLNIVLMFLQTFERFEPYMGIIRVLEGITGLIFVVEYVLRLWTADQLYPEEQNHVKAAWRFAKSFDGIILLLTILPYQFRYTLFTDWF